MQIHLNRKIDIVSILFIGTIYSVISIFEVNNASNSNYSILNIEGIFNVDRFPISIILFFGSLFYLVSGVFLLISHTKKGFLQTGHYFFLIGLVGIETSLILKMMHVYLSHIYSFGPVTYLVWIVVAITPFIVHYLFYGFIPKQQEDS